MDNIDKLSDAFTGATTSVVSLTHESIDKIVDSLGKTGLTVKTNMRQKLPAIVIGSLTLIAGLTWNDAFTAVINKYVPAQYRAADNARAKLIYAFCLTIAIIIAITIIVQYSPK